MEVPKITYNENRELVIVASAGSSASDFDFFQGKSKVRNRKLLSRLSGCTDWKEFESTQQMYKILNGIGNIDNYLASFDGVVFEGMSLRLFDLHTRLWSIYWADSDHGTLEAPVVGSFEHKVGHFFGKQLHLGQPVLVVFRWDARDERRPVWSQAFSADDGESWEWNWYMYMEKQS